MNVFSVDIICTSEPHVVIELENGERVTMPLDGKPENEAVLARIFGDDAADPVQA